MRRPGCGSVGVMSNESMERQKWAITGSGEEGHTGQRRRGIDKDALMNSGIRIFSDFS